jgi:hypothetical protein
MTAWIVNPKAVVTVKAAVAASRPQAWRRGGRAGAPLPVRGGAAAARRIGIGRCLDRIPRRWPRDV